MKNTHFIAQVECTPALACGWSGSYSNLRHVSPPPNTTESRLFYETPMPRKYKKSW